jgi:Cu(I)-responsive transcriptional regulator
MNIAAAARRAGLNAKTIRYYEDLGLIVPGRRDNGYRDYSEGDIHRLSFLARARRLGFSLEECRQLLSLYQDRDRASADVKAIAASKLEEMDRRLAELRSLRAALAHLVDSCAGDERPDCPILSDLAEAAAERRLDSLGEA